MLGLRRLLPVLPQAGHLPPVLLQASQVPGHRAAPGRRSRENPGAKDPRLETVVETFCRRTRDLRAQTGLPKKDFAESIGEYAGTYSAWENASLPGSYSVPKLALCLGTTTDYLYGLTDDPPPGAARHGSPGPGITGRGSVGWC